MIRKLLSTIRGWWNNFRDPTRGLQKHHNRLLLEARNLQRKGDIPAFAAKTREAAEVEKKIDELKTIV